MRWNIIVECVGKDGKQSKITLGTIEQLAGSTTAENLGVNLQESKQIVNRLQDTVVKQQLEEHCEQRRKCLTCGRLRPIKDYRRRRLDTVLGTVRLNRAVGKTLTLNWPHILNAKSSFLGERIPTPTGRASFDAKSSRS
jgi:hypothetical protein